MIGFEHMPALDGATGWLNSEPLTPRDGRLYQLVRQHNGVRDQTLEIKVVEPGAEAYAFTFG